MTLALSSISNPLKEIHLSTEPRCHRLLVLSVVLLMGFAAASSTVSAAAKAPVPSLAHLRCEYKADPIGIDSTSPRLSWRLQSDARGVVQAAYRVQVAADQAKWGRKSVLWDTGKVDSDRSTQVPYEGPALESGRRYYWRVRVWDGNDRRSKWSEPAFWEMGLLQPGDWQAAWVTPAGDEDTSKSQPAPMLRGTFELDGKVKSARAYVTSFGLYELEINGRRVGDEVFTPGWTSYHNRLQYQTYDVTKHVRQGDNVVGASLGDGWYRGFLGWGDRRNAYGDRLALLCQLVITYSNGRVEIVGTDDTWKSTTGPILQSDIYMGEAYDARLDGLVGRTSGSATHREPDSLP